MNINSQSAEKIPSNSDNVVGKDEKWGSVLSEVDKLNQPEQELFKLYCKQVDLSERLVESEKAIESKEVEKIKKLAGEYITAARNKYN